MKSRLLEVFRAGTDPRLVHWSSTPQGGKGSTPPPPDYAGAAAQQAASSRELTDVQNWANRPQQKTPWGQTSWTQKVMKDPATGRPVTQWTQNQTLTPMSQRALNDQLGIAAGRSDLAGDFMGRVEKSYKQPFGWNKFDKMAKTPQAEMLRPSDLDTKRIGSTTETTNEPAFASERRRIEEGLFARMRPEQQRQEDSIRTMLANQGLTPGSEAYNQELQRLHQQQSGERYDALMRGGEEQARLQQMLLGQQQQAFGQDITSQQALNAARNLGFGQRQAAGAQNFANKMQSAGYQNARRQQQIAEAAQRRGMSLNEMNALLTGQQVATPSMPGFSQAAGAQPLQALAAAQMQGQYGLQAAQMDQQNNPWGDIAKLAGSAAMFMSDRRLKSDIVRVGTHPLGVGIYDFTIFGERQRGVMADELLKVRPDLVAVHSSGYLMVNYGGL